MHPSCLPFYKGPAPLIRQIECGDRIGGMSIIELHPQKFDLGNVFLQWVFNIPFDITCKEFEEGAANHGAHAVIQVLDKYGEYSEKLSPQASATDPIIVREEIPQLEADQKVIFNESATSKLSSLPKGTTIQADEMISEKRPTYARILKSTDGNIDWKSFTALQVYNKWRAFSRKPGLFTFMTWPPNSETVQRVKLLSLEPPTNEENNDPTMNHVPGEVSFTKGDKFLSIQTAEGKRILCSSIQVQGKKPKDPEGFFNGYLSSFPHKKTVP